MILFRVMRRIPCTIVGIYDRYQLDVKSDIEWLLQKAAFDESENDKLHRIRVSFENELNEIRAQLQQLKECADLQETLDFNRGENQYYTPSGGCLEASSVRGVDGTVEC